MGGPLETEIKIQLPAAHGFPDCLLALSFKEHAPRIFEANTLFDTQAGQLRNSNMMLRLRQAGSRAAITWKGKAIEGPHKSRPELETEIGSFDMTSQILSRLGFTPVFRYEKYRTEFRIDDSGIVTFDETPIGDFLELEGKAQWIDRTAGLLGFSPSDYRLESYGELFELHRAKQGISMTDMTFESYR